MARESDVRDQASAGQVACRNPSGRATPARKP